MWTPARERLSGFVTHLENRQLSTYWQARAPAVLALLAPSKADRVLDLGCGEGLWSSYLAQRVGELVSLDLSDDLLHRARLWRSPRAPLRPLADGRFVQGDGCRLPFRDASFTKVIALDVVDIIPDDAACLGEVHRVLAPGGVFVMSTIAGDRPSYWRRAVFSEHLREYSEGQIAALQATAGFQITDWAYFYFWLRTLALELHIATSRPAGVSVRLLRAAALAAVGAPERWLRLGRPSGIVVRALKHL